MAREQETQRQGSRKLSKRKKPPRAPSIQYPERLREGDDTSKDAAAATDYPGQSVNQSVLSMITKVGSATDFHKRFDEESSDTDEDPLDKNTASVRTQEPADVAVEEDAVGPSSHVVQEVKNESQSHHARASLRLQTATDVDPMSQSMFLPPKQSYTIHGSSKNGTPQNAPVMSQMLEAQADFGSSDKGSNPEGEKTEDTIGTRRTAANNDLAMQLKMIFGFDSPEEVIAEYPCWLTQSVLLQGYMYITTRHICFYAYAPKKINTVVKSGHLSKRGKQNPKYNRYWFQLKGDELSYRTDPSDPYFRSGNIDLRYGISANLLEGKDKSKGGSKDLSIVTPHREYLLKADSAASAREWVKQLQRVIFRSHNKGDSFKISMPIENVVDVEDAPVMDIAETIKVRVADADEGFAVFAVDEVTGISYVYRSKLICI